MYKYTDHYKNRTLYNTQNRNEKMGGLPITVTNYRAL